MRLQDGRRLLGMDGLRRYSARSRMNSTCSSAVRKPETAVLAVPAFAVRFFFATLSFLSVQPCCLSFVNAASVSCQCLVQG